MYSSAFIFPNTNSWYHSMLQLAACTEEAASYRCQYPCWPLSLPQPQHPHGTGGLSCRTKEWGFLRRTGNRTFLSQWREWPAGSIITHFKLCPTWAHCAGKQSCSSTFEWGRLVLPVCSWESCVLREFLLFSALLLTCCSINKHLKGTWGWDI